jgi:hypothetical protein
LFCWCFSSMWVVVGFQLEPQLTFRYTVISVKPWFMALSHFTTSSRKLVAKSRLRYRTHALL